MPDDSDKPLLDEMEALAASSEATDDVIIPDPDKPKRGRPKGEGKKEKLAPAYRQGMFVKPLTQMYTMGGIALTPFDEKCGTVIIKSAESCAVIAAHAPILIAVSTHHVPVVQAMLAKVATAGIPTTEDNPT
jgi:hypothetical protein